eukprot:5017400-Pyramimonas_sp.AAC.1
MEATGKDPNTAPQRHPMYRNMRETRRIGTTPVAYWVLLGLAGALLGPPGAAWGLLGPPWASWS